MTDQTTVQADPAATARAQHEALWEQLRADVAAVTATHPGPDAVARLLWEALTVGFARGAGYASDCHRDGRRPPVLSDARIIDRVLGYAKTADTDPRVAALHQLTQARTAAQAATAPVEHPGVVENGGNGDD